MKEKVRKGTILLSFMFLMLASKTMSVETCYDGEGMGIYDFDSGACLHMNTRDYFSYILGPFEYTGENSGFGAIVGAIIGGGLGSGVGGGTSGSFIGGYVGSSIGSSISDSMEGKSNEYAEEKWNNKNENSTSWRFRRR
ncbi:Glycine zipper [Fusobacterium necrophorum subsp. funduliforme]|uniref:hypothetical protein n=1 Tax=Fusobacterium necrophorum TaxID=859 RepID=UPI00370E74A9